MKILLIEDEQHKREEIGDYISEFGDGTIEVNRAVSVHDAVQCVRASEYDLIILDMALPTFTTSAQNPDSGLDQALGGLEVLRALKMNGTKSRIAIVTQYPEIRVGAQRFKLRMAQKVLSQRYGQDVIAAIPYKYKSASNRTRILDLLRGIV